VLLTAEAAAQDPHLAREALTQCLKAALDLLEGLGNYAGEHQGLPPVPDGSKTLQTNLEGWETGSNTKPKTQRPPEGQSLIALSAPDGLVAATPKTAAIYAGENMDLGAQQNAHVTAGQQLVANAGKGMSFFSHSGGFKAIAHKDEMDIQAQHGPLSLMGQEVKIYALEKEILACAKEKITLMAGGSYISISADGIECGGPAFDGKTGNVTWSGSASLNGDMPKVDSGDTQRKIQFGFKGADQQASGLGYQIEASDGTKAEGNSDAKGLTDLVKDDTLKVLKVHAKPPKDLV
jgi:type VI secretion system secreted protein VgrG